MTPIGISYTVNIPTCLDIEMILQNYPLKPRYLANKPEKLKNRALFLIGQIYNSLHTSKLDIDGNDWAILSSRVLRKVIDNYKEYLEYFMEQGVIECDGSFCNYPNRGKCYGYRYTEKYRQKGWQPLTITESKLVDKIYNSLRDDSAKLIYPMLHEAFHHLEIDEDLVLETLNNIYPNEDGDFYKQLNLTRRLKSPQSWNFSTCYTGRLFNPITGLKSEIRDLLEINGERLVKLDIKNSIPYFSLALFNETLLENNLEVRNIILSCNKKLFNKQTPILSKSKTSKNKSGPLIPYSKDYHFKKVKLHMTPSKVINERHSSNVLLKDPYYPKSLVWEGYNPETKEGKIANHIMWRVLGLEDAKNDDVVRFKEEVLIGGIYMLLCTAWNKELSKNYTRKSAKKKLLQILNSPSRYNSKEKNIFKRMFPNVVKIICKLSKGYFTTMNGKGTNKRKKGDLRAPFSVYTQRLESWFILDVVCTKVHEINPRIPLYTVHDEILTLHKHEQLVRETITEESARIFGYQVRIG